jgi:hypothetical protein
VLGVLAKLRALIVEIEAQLAELQTELLARVKDQVTPKGLGDLTLVTLDGEVCDWHRFRCHDGLNAAPLSATVRT